MALTAERQNFYMSGKIAEKMAVMLPRLQQLIHAQLKMEQFSLYLVVINKGI